MKICLYLEFYNFLGGILFKKIGTGLLSSYKNQRTMLKYLNIEFTEKWDDSCDILQINTPWLRSIYLMKKAKRMGKKVIIWSHVTAEDAAQVFWFNKFLFPLIKRYLAYAYGLADLVFSPTEYTKSLLVAYGLSPEKIIARSNAVDLKKFYKDPALRESGRKKYDLKTTTVGTVALVIPRKGIDTFLAIAEKFPKLSFPWFGKIYSGLLVRPLPKNIPANVKFTGHIDSVNEAYNAMDIFVFPSYEENQGMVILEAGAVGLPVIVRDIPVYNGWLIHGKNCLKAKNNEGFEKCVKILVEDKKMREELGNNAKELAGENSIEVLSRSIEQIYRNLLAR
ncbi:MAG: glycosyltransferase family 4 protein [Patescibacteria group bacterium]|nr:glycosyltransferase family 4 protein [Patescibacteria group bacterium]